MSLPTTCKAFVVQNPPTGPVDLGPGLNSTFALTQVDIGPLGDNQVFLQTVFLSNDPAQRVSIQKDTDADRAYTAPVRAGGVVDAHGIAKVLGSTSPEIEEGTLVITQTGWREYLIADTKAVQPITLGTSPIPGFSPTVFIGALGVPGLTAYFGLVEVLKLQKGESIVVSGAAGAIGNIVVQYAKHVIGASKVIAITGSDKKCEWLKKIGADISVNYKSPNFKLDLVAATDGFVDTFFDNVGGPILDFMFTRIRRHGRIAASGSISSYNDRNQNHFPNYTQLITNRLTLLGFIVLDYYETRYMEGFNALLDALKLGKITLENGEMVIKCSFEDVPKVWSMLFTGGNTGKLVTELVNNSTA